MQTRVGAVAGDQFGVRTGLLHASAIQHDHLVGMLDGRQAHARRILDHGVQPGVDDRLAVARFQHADVSDGLAVIDSLGGPVPPQLAGLLASIAVSWTWYQGAIGTAPTSTSHGIGTTSAARVLTIASGLPSGAGFLLVRTVDASGVYYQPGTVS